MLAGGLAAGLAIIAGAISAWPMIIALAVSASVCAAFVIYISQPSDDLSRPREDAAGGEPAPVGDPDVAAASSAAVTSAVIVHAAEPPGTLSRALGVVSVWLRDARQRRATRRLRLRPQTLPPRLTTFQGRATDLVWLRQRHDQLRRTEQRSRWARRTGSLPSRTAGASGESPVSRPQMLFIYGRPGVGKSALAQELAHQLKTTYPHGQLYQNLGVAGGRRSEHDILRGFLKDLGWPEAELRNADVTQLGNMFRSATNGRRLLVVLDAARDAGQIEAVLPRSSQCAVIVTSRAKLSETESGAWHLRTPSPAESARMLQAYLTDEIDPPEDHPASPELIAEATQLCGHQPIALVAVGNKARTMHNGLETVVRSLRNRDTRLERLAYGARDVAERIATEYDRLGRHQQTALQALALVRSPSFVPWVLQPLLDTSLPEAANLMASLSEVGLLDELDADPAGFPRYGFSPLIRLFAERELRKSLDATGSQPEILRKARMNFRLGMVMLSKLISAELEPGTNFGNGPEEARKWIPEVIDHWKERVASNAGFWVRAEFLDLIDAVSEASLVGLPTLTWKLCARLSDYHANHSFSQDFTDAFEKAQAAAEEAGGALAIGSVLLAQGSCLLAAEQYAEAMPVLNDALQAAGLAGDWLTLTRIRRLMGQAAHRAGDYAAANMQFQAALMQVQSGTRSGVAAPDAAAEERIIRSLIAENDVHTEMAQWKNAYHPAPGNDGKISVTEHLVAARDARRRNDLDDCRQELDNAAKAVNDKCARIFELELERYGYELDLRKGDGEQLTDVIAGISHLVVDCDEADARISSVDARLLLARALLAGDSANGNARDRASACLRTLDRLQLERLAADRAGRQQAQHMRLRGEAKLLLGDLVAAEQALHSAVSGFGQLADKWSQAEAQLLLGRTQLMAAAKAKAQFRTAMKAQAQLSLLSARDIFQQCGDRPHADEVAMLAIRLAARVLARGCYVRVRSWLSPPSG